jgi:hypothetical protein
VTLNISNPSLGSVFGAPARHTSALFDAETSFFNTGTSFASGTQNSDVLDIGSGLLEADLIILVGSVASGANATVTIELSEDEAFTTPLPFLTVHIPQTHTGTLSTPFKNAFGNDGPKRFMRLSVGTSAALKIGAFITKRINTP